MEKQLNLALSEGLFRSERTSSRNLHCVSKFIFTSLDKTALVVFLIKKRAIFDFVSLKFYHGFS